MCAKTFKGYIPEKEEKRNRMELFGLLTVYCFVLMLFCTKSSPLFVFNDWYDANVYYTMGKGLMNGRVPYVDLIDNKGPFLYFLYGLAWLIDKNGFLGMYIIQSIFVTLSSVFAYRLAKLYINSASIAFVVSVASPLPMLVHRFYAADFDFGGGGPDELCRALLIAALYYFSLFYMRPQEYKMKYTWIQGILFMCVFLMKFNLCVFWMGFLLSIAAGLIKDKKSNALMQHMGAFLFGASLVLFPYLLYSVITNSLPEFIKNYFLYNWLYVNQSSNVFLRVIEALLSSLGLIGGMWWFALLFSMGIVFVLFQTQKGLGVGYVVSTLLLLTSVYYTTLRFATIHIPFTVTLIYGMVFAGCLLDKIVRDQKSKARTIYAAIAALLLFSSTVMVNGLYKYELFLTKQDSAQQRVAEILWEKTRTKVPSLLEINSLDSGFYTAAGIIPDEPYFFIYNMDYDLFPYPYDAQREAVENGVPEYVIVSSHSQEAQIIPYDIHSIYEEKWIIQGTGYQKLLWYHVFQIRKA